MAIKADIVTAPAPWLDALVNDDYSGLNDADRQACCAWRENIAPAFVVYTDPNSRRFTWSYSLHGGTACGGEVIDYVTHEIRE